MMSLRAALASTAGLLLLAGCGQSATAPATPAAKPDLTVTFDGQRHKCIVALSREAQGNTVACSDVVSFVKEELRLPGGSTYAVRDIAPIDDATVSQVRAGLDGAGYRFAGG
ncbi:MAG TPA: hypothetical protein VME42_02165 [Steroidobacteraceae bacterium]|nr:hypothetical protein [Steroidobacteraceae bacterium]